MVDTLYIIGNGFDLHHKMRTSYLCFYKDYLKKQKQGWLNFFETIFGDSPKNEIWWHDFETKLNQIDYSYGMDSHNGIIPFVSALENILRNQIPSLFGDWIQNVNDNVEPDSSLRIDKDALFFTFNYTMVLEKAYQVDKDRIWHIHHSMKDYKRNGVNPVVGHDADMGQLTKQLNDFMTDNPNFRYDIADKMNQNIYGGGKKVKDRIWRHKDRFGQYCDIKHFIVMGFSFNDIDMPYIKKIISENRQIQDTDWQLYFYDKKDEEAINKLNDIGIIREQILTPIWW